MDKQELAVELVKIAKELTAASSMEQHLTYDIHGLGSSIVTAVEMKLKKTGLRTKVSAGAGTYFINLENSEENLQVELRADVKRSQINLRISNKGKTVVKTAFPMSADISKVYKLINNTVLSELLPL